MILQTMRCILGRRGLTWHNYVGARCMCMCILGKRRCHSDVMVTCLRSFKSGTVSYHQALENLICDKRGLNCMSLPTCAMWHIRLYS